MTTLIFVHGACVRDAQWWWAQMTRPLADHGITSVAVPLPSCGETGDELGDLYADVDACREAVSAAEGPVVLCGHSYGGMVITEAGADDRVTQLLYVTSVMPDAGQSQAELIGSEPAPWLQPGEDGTVGVDPDMIREFFLQDCDESTTEQALDRLTRQSLTPFTQPPRQIAWQQKPATYFVCTEDLATPADVQRRRVKDETRLVEFAAGHHPFLSRPDNSRKAWPPRSITISRKTVGFWFVAIPALLISLPLTADCRTMCEARAAGKAGPPKRDGCFPAYRQSRASPRHRPDGLRDRRPGAPGFRRKEEPVLARFWLTATAALDDNRVSVVVPDAPLLAQPKRERAAFLPVLLVRLSIRPADALGGRPEGSPRGRRVADAER